MIILLTKTGPIRGVMAHAESTFTRQSEMLFSCVQNNDTDHEMFYRAVLGYRVSNIKGRTTTPDLTV